MLKLTEIEIIMIFFVRENISAHYFIVGTNNLLKYKILLLNNNIRWFKIVKDVFEFDEYINTIEKVNFEEFFHGEVLRDD